ncbi:regulator of G-protein signaling 20 isoform X6 [Patagioenas fasciata]|uniref:regulator of G-protein signaling 20 isoform X6 n=1 Tax=Patagioenas fasciata TaxID=372321 RepID=UPI003A9937F9
MPGVPRSHAAAAPRCPRATRRSAHGIRADGDAQTADVYDPGDVRRCIGPTQHREPGVQRLLLLLVLLLQLLMVTPVIQASGEQNSRGGSLTVRNQDEERARRTSHELQAEGIPNCEESPTPTLEEVNAWAQSFDKLMLTPAGRNAFREFLRTEFSEENMLFWMACEELKQESNKSVIEEKARLIYEDYISILSPKEVSLDSRVREVINRNMLEPSQHTFDDAQLQIYTLMHRDSYPRFMNSAIYKDLLRSLSEKSIEA